MPLLSAKPLDFADRHAVDTDLKQGNFDLLQLERLDHGLNQFDLLLSLYHRVLSRSRHPADVLSAPRGSLRSPRFSYEYARSLC